MNISMPEAILARLSIGVFVGWCVYQLLYLSVGVFIDWCVCGLVCLSIGVLSVGVKSLV